MADQLRAPLGMEAGWNLIGIGMQHPACIARADVAILN